MIAHALADVSDASRRVKIITARKSAGDNGFFGKLMEKNAKQDLSPWQQKLKLEMNRIFSSWMRQVLEHNPNLEFGIYLSDGSVSVRSFFYSQENLGKTLELCDKGRRQIDGIEGFSPMLRMVRHRMRIAIVDVYAAASDASQGKTSYFFPINMPPEGSSEYAIKLTEAKMAQPFWLAKIWGGIAQAGYVEKLEKIGYAGGNEIEHMEKCFASLPGAVRRLEAAKSAKEAKYDDVSSVLGATYFLCHSVIDMEMEIGSQADSNAGELVSYLKAKLYDNGKLLSLFISALSEGGLEKGQLERLILEKPGGLYYEDIRRLVSESATFKGKMSQHKLKYLAQTAAHIFELSKFFTEE